MTIKDVLDAAGRSDVHLYLDGDTLKYKAPSGGLPDALRQRIREHRAGIVDYLKGVARRAAEPEFLSGVIDHLLTDEALLVAFAEDAALEPSSVAAARYRLPGAMME